MAPSRRWSKSFWTLVCLSNIAAVVTVVHYVARSERMRMQTQWYNPEGLRKLKAVRKENPIVPLGDRLAKLNQSPTPITTSPPITAEEDDELKDFETRLSRSATEVRDMRLSSLHQDTLTEFAETMGFGEDRLWYGVIHGSQKLTSEDPPPIPLGESAISNSSGRPLLQESPSPVPLLRLANLHRTSFRDFVNPDRLGVVLSTQNIAKTVTWKVNGDRITQEVQDWSQIPTTSPLRPLSVGHTEHSMTDRVKQEFEKQLTDWQLSKLELVSLLKSPTPRVYLSRNLPNMKELAHARTRELNEFETASLAKLQSGEGLLIESDHAEIRMLGSVRAASQCVHCHSVQRGTLLGAFTYTLHRVATRTENVEVSLDQ